MLALLPKYIKRGSALENAIQEWQNVLGEAYVDLDVDHLSQISNTTFATTQEVPVILRPGNSQEVQACVRIANQFKIPIYTISTGKNWGFGSAVPCQDQCVLMHLSRMNKISDLNLIQACVTIEPGVTQGQLADFLVESNSNLLVDINGASPDCSIIGNIMERGVGHSEYGARISYICNLEVVLPNGEIIETGLGKFDNAKAVNVYQWGIGPSLDGLFSQSNLGIVTRLTIWLMPKPEKVECFYFTVSGEENLKVVVDALQPLRLRRVLQSAVHIGNNYKVLNTYGQYPWEKTNGETPLPKNVLNELVAARGCNEWSGSGAMHGTIDQIKETKRLIRKALKGKVSKLSFLSDNTLAIAKRFPKLISFITRVDLAPALPIIEAVYGMAKGVPSFMPMASAYWRKKTPIPDIKDPDRDRCGLVWYSALAPIAGVHASAIYNEAKTIMISYSFEPLITFIFMSERVLCSVICISYDRDVPGEDLKAMQCHDAIIETLKEKGYYPYRLGIQNMKKLPPDNSEYQKLMNLLKKTLDPNHILSPGRYE